MTPESRHFLGRLLGMALLVTTLMSCSSASVGPGGRISKVKYYHLIPEMAVNSQDPAIEFERNYHLYGAIRWSDVMNRGGHYYDIFWKVDDRTQPVTVRFEYRQANLGLTSKTMEQEVTDVRRSNVTKFRVLGSDYRRDGRITAWKVSLVRGREVLAAHESYLWN